MGQITRIALLLFCSGLCALVYQMAWLRELRLVFGASTPASAAVLAVFMGGVGGGSLWLGERADRAARPLLLYAKLEGGIAVSAALSPLLLVGVRAVYVAVGGTAALGLGVGTVTRVVLAALVLLPPTLLMGGTLPAAARAAMPVKDGARKSVALLYGANTLGAVAGALLATFMLFEAFGDRMTLWLAAAVNVAVAFAAHNLARRLPVMKPRKRAKKRRQLGASPRFVLVAAAGVGFAFLLMEMVWYRMLSPLLGGSTYTFGVIIAIALLGVGVGGLLYGRVFSRRRPTVLAFALSCAFEALCLAVPLALGDRIAVFAVMTWDFGGMGFVGQVMQWTMITAIVVLPAAVVSGYQFPLLVALLGRGGREVARHVGSTYAANTAGAIGGSLLGGFVLIPVLTAPGCWKLAIWILALLAAAALAFDYASTGVARSSRMARVAVLPVVVLAPSMAHAAVGPTAVWRHSEIATGLGSTADVDTPNGLQKWMRERRRFVTWEREGRESSLGVFRRTDTAFIVNGRTDGSAIGDAGTQVMAGLIGALRHGNVRRVLVIGLGSGATAGWLAAVPSVERVDVIELEPAMLEVARRFTPVNLGALDNPKVKVQIGDAREQLLTSSEHYDLIFSEPSNPFRSGIASLFTQELYLAARDRLAPGGVFVQWLQAYSIDAVAARTAYATLVSVFPSVESWQSQRRDLTLVCRDRDSPIDVSELRRVLATPPFRRAMQVAWRTDVVEGLLARHVASPALAREVAAAGAINTDDKNLLEFGFARTIGRVDGLRIPEMRALAAARGASRPELAGADANVDWARVVREIALIDAFRETGVLERLQREIAADPRSPHGFAETSILADYHAARGDAAAEPLIERLRAVQPVEASALLARLRFAQKRHAEAAAAVAQTLAGYREDAWPLNGLIQNTLALTVSLAVADRAFAMRMFDELAQPFALDQMRESRLIARLDLAEALADNARCVTALLAFEPHFPWTKAMLERRLRCYRTAGHRLTARAQAELARFVDQEGAHFDAGLPTSPAQ